MISMLQSTLIFSSIFQRSYIDEILTETGHLENDCGLNMNNIICLQEKKSYNTNECSLHFGGPLIYENPSNGKSELYAVAISYDTTTFRINTFLMKCKNNNKYAVKTKSIISYKTYLQLLNGNQFKRNRYLTLST